MDYICHKLGKKIELYSDREDYGNQKLLLQVKFEYELLLLMSYLWNKNINDISDEKREILYKLIQTPSIGDIVRINRELDTDKELINSKKVREVINKYPSFRNEKIGHGYSFSDDIREFVKTLNQMIEDLEENVPILKSEYNIVNVEKNIDGLWEGVLYQVNEDYNNWTQREEDCCLEKGLYLVDNKNNYYKISPFIYMDEEKIYAFRCIDEILLGKFKYNRLFETGTITKEWKEFKNLLISEDGFKKVSINGTIINKFENNYSSYQYVETKSIQKKIDDFIRNQSCVYATLWGHGGVGKTAAVQNFCEKLETDSKRKFDYILFVSAKDRLYDSYTGTIKPINNDATFVTIIKNLNKLISNEEVFDVDKILSSDAKFLLIIDDYETFSAEDKKKIETFVRSLNINNHKVLITTRSNSILGEEIKTNELNVEETSKFLIEIYKGLFRKDISQKLKKESVKKEVHNVTSGRPIFILQFAYICSQNGIDKAVAKDIKNSKEAIEFLYGRIYDYLNSKAQKMFGVLGVLADSDDMTNLLDKVKYILNMEDDAKFGDCIDEIEKLRLIEIIDNKFYKVYSKEILDIMKEYFEKNDDAFKKTVRSKIIQVSKDKNLDNDHALLKNANSARYSKSEQEVIKLYQLILKRNTKKEIKINALLNLAEYLYNDRGNKEKAIQMLEKYRFEFNDETSCVKMLAVYLRGNQNTEKAIKVLLDFFSTGRNFKNDEILELFGILVTYRCLFWLDLREETKTGYKYEEIYEEDYKKQMNEQSKAFRSIKKKQGSKLIEIVNNIDFSKITSGARQNLITAIYQYVEVCIRIGDWQSGRYLCTYVNKKLSNYNYGLNFELKEKRIIQYEADQKKKKYSTQKKNMPV